MNHKPVSMDWPSPFTRSRIHGQEWSNWTSLCWWRKEKFARWAEMQKTADISVLFFSAGANFWTILGHFWAILEILGHFWANMGNFESFLGYFGSFWVIWPFFCVNFFWQNMHLCYLNHFLQLWRKVFFQWACRIILGPQKHFFTWSHPPMPLQKL